MARQVGMFDVEERLAGLTKKGDDLERLAAVIDFELFRPELERAVPRADRAKGGRPPFDHVLMFKADAAAYGGARLAELLGPGNTASDVWAGTGYRSRQNEALLRQRMLTSHIHRKKPTGRPMPPRTARANAKKSAIRARIEHVFAEQKARMGLFVRTIGLARATTKIGLANLVHNMRRLLWLERQPALA
jgi:IS5 family transposase